jgi:hypothetical protein
MGHRIECLVYKEGPVNQLLQTLKSARYIKLDHGFVAVPIDEPLLQEFAELHNGDRDARSVVLGEIEPDSVPIAFLEAVSLNHVIAYVRTRYFGGIGEQAAGVWENGRVVLGPLVDQRPGPINASLQRIGVPRSKGSLDEFDSVGLPKYRRFDKDD